MMKPVLKALLDPPRTVEPTDPSVAVIPENERLFTVPTIITFVRTAVSVLLSALAVRNDSLTLLVIGLIVFWVGDSADGQVARRTGRESRIGALLDVFSDRICAAGFYIGYVWLTPDLAPAVFVYLFEYMVIDQFLSMCFVFWPIRSSNYFYVIDRRMWQWNWSHPGKATNSGLFALMLLIVHPHWHGVMWVGLGIACALLTMKSISLARMLRLGLPLAR